MAPTIASCFGHAADQLSGMIIDWNSGHGQGGRGGIDLDSRVMRGSANWRAEWDAGERSCSGTRSRMRNVEQDYWLKLPNPVILVFITEAEVRVMITDSFNRASLLQPHRLHIQLGPISCTLALAPNASKSYTSRGHLPARWLRPARPPLLIPDLLHPSVPSSTHTTAWTSSLRALRGESLSLRPLKMLKQASKCVASV